ncbi:hypothetical protein [Tepidiforma thermophila]|uniref:Uncharacterized protein n=1 Tax=Tepidiforma thermophila (strain KCTC 52669 / CGMCC 1.13589 / G233) TaxID=2761530 RepID=A0A2A9HEY5_TEPT2|nr:hypothetical protein [Tepidiforma thermophila]PFG73575.1 hypothetical protein A9A59_0776 [Tepidiforma thermophila]
MQMAELAAELAEGMFPTEVVAEVSDVDGRTVTFIAPSTRVVRRTNGRGQVLVRVVQQGSRGLVVELPGDVYGAVRYIEVPLSAVSA